MKNCVWIENTGGDKKFKCENCGFEVNNNNLQKNCSKFKDPPKEKDNLQPPPLPKRMFNFGKATIKHWLHGNPTCSDGEIQDRLDICMRCDLFKRFDAYSGVCTHDDCGCTIKSVKQYLNKLAWADQSCPIEKWGPIDKKGV